MVHTHIGLCFHVCKEISNLTELKSVALSACLATNICCERERNQEKTSPLWIVAKKCCKLNKLEIYGCQRCKSHSTRYGCSYCFRRKLYREFDLYSSIRHIIIYFVLYVE
ncbi:uncharacterized protein LOC111613893 [Centruroides sculpturatus]|uniref:uncharacterized protein LOC111613893 n=1 Tax=Centruroides sculpturatus TaxID=218467 RepID=UPI000C6CF2D5|nr:uncharacterized protein LOC111613893 [Centruroides sculpturatus]